MKHLLFISIILFSNLTYAKNKVAATRKPASEEAAEDCKIVKNGFYGESAMIFEGFYIANCGGSIKYSPANPAAAKLYTQKNGDIAFVEPQSAIGKFPASLRKIESKSNIIKDGKTFSSLTIAKDKRIQKRYVFEHQDKAILSMSYVDAETGDKNFVDTNFCYNELPILQEKMEKIASGCSDLVNEIEKKLSDLPLRDNGSLEIAQSGLVIKNKETKVKSSLSSFNKLAELSKMCAYYSTIITPHANEPAKGQFGIGSGASAIGM